MARKCYRKVKLRKLNRNIVVTYAKVINNDGYKLDLPSELNRNIVVTYAKVINNDGYKLDLPPELILEILRHLDGKSLLQVIAMKREYLYIAARLFSITIDNWITDIEIIQAISRNLQYFMQRKFYTTAGCTVLSTSVYDFEDFTCAIYWCGRPVQIYCYAISYNFARIMEMGQNLFPMCYST